MLASTLIAEVAADIFDGDYERWDEDYHLASLNAGERQLVFFKPTAYIIAGVYQLAAGPRQSLPDGTSSYQDPAAATLLKAIELVEITRNMGTDGLTAGTAIVPVEIQDIDELYPGWRAVTAAATVQHVMFDKNDRTTFSVFPKQPSASMGWIEAVYSAVPTAIATVGGSYAVDCNLSDEYAEPLKNYMKFRAYSMDAANSQYSADRALAHWNLFLMQIGRKDLVEQRYPSRRNYGNSNQQLSQ